MDKIFSQKLKDEFKRGVISALKTYDDLGCDLQTIRSMTDGNYICGQVLDELHQRLLIANDRLMKKGKVLPFDLAHKMIQRFINECINDMRECYKYDKTRILYNLNTTEEAIQFIASDEFDLVNNVQPEMIIDHLLSRTPSMEQLDTISQIFMKTFGPVVICKEYSFRRFQYFTIMDIFEMNEFDEYEAGEYLEMCFKKHEFLYSTDCSLEELQTYFQNYGCK
jgi:hypothetical protein